MGTLAVQVHHVGGEGGSDQQPIGQQHNNRVVDVMRVVGQTFGQWPPTYAAAAAAAPPPAGSTVLGWEKISSVSSCGSIDGPTNAPGAGEGFQAGV